MNIIKKIFVLSSLLCAFIISAPSFAVTATIDVDKVLFEYSKAKTAAEQFKAQEMELQNAVLDAQKKIKATSSPVEKKNLEAAYDKKLKAQAEKMQAEQLKKLQEIEKDIFTVINKVNNGKYDLILKKTATVYCANDITDEVIKRLNNK